MCECGSIDFVWIDEVCRDVGWELRGGVKKVRGWERREGGRGEEKEVCCGLGKYGGESYGIEGRVSLFEQYYKILNDCNAVDLVAFFSENVKPAELFPKMGEATDASTNYLLLN